MCVTGRMDRDSSMTIDWTEFLHHIILNPVENVGELVSSWKHSLVKSSGSITLTLFAQTLQQSRGVKIMLTCAVISKLNNHTMSKGWQIPHFACVGFWCRGESCDAHWVPWGGVWFWCMENICSCSRTGRCRVPDRDGSHWPSKDPTSGQIYSQMPSRHDTLKPLWMYLDLWYYSSCFKGVAQYYRIWSPLMHLRFCS